MGAVEQTLVYRHAEIPQGQTFARTTLIEDADVL